VLAEEWRHDDCDGLEGGDLTMATEFVIYTDESVKDGDYFSNFYGGVLVRSVDLLSVSERLADVKAEQNLHGELKWTKVTENYLDKYMAVMDAYFDLILVPRNHERDMTRTKP